MDNSFSRFILMCVLLSVVLITGCSQTSSTRNIDYFTGISGMSFSFVPSAPPDSVYENSQFGVSVIVRNDGPVDVLDPGAVQITSSYDPFYFTPQSQTTLGGNGIGGVSIQLHGKTQNYPGGDQTYLDYAIYTARTIQGTRQIPTSQIFLNLCYPYKTILDTDTCVDVSSVFPSDRAQSCTAQPQTFSGQGSPVAITSVTSEFLPYGIGTDHKIKPVFNIAMQNEGGGVLLAPATSGLFTSSVCSLENQNRANWSTVVVNASLLGTALDCVPSVVRVTDTQPAFTRCSVPNNHLIPAQVNYQTQLHVELSYVYMKGISKDITIVRTAQNELPSTASGTTPTVCDPNLQIQMADPKTGKNYCAQKCDFCATNPTDYRCTTLTASETRYASSFTWTPSFSCGCTRDDCFTKEPLGKCIFDMCLGGTYCCSQ